MALANLRKSYQRRRNLGIASNAVWSMSLKAAMPAVPGTVAAALGALYAPRGGATH
jgi:hypothetical protein